MLTKNLMLVAFCVVLLGGIIGAAALVGPTDAPDLSKDTQTTRKGGDMFIFYSGRSYHRSVSSHSRTRSGRLGSTGNRTFRGGGLHGGK